MVDPSVSVDCSKQAQFAMMVNRTYGHYLMGGNNIQEWLWKCAEESACKDFTDFLTEHDVDVEECEIKDRCSWQEDSIMVNLEISSPVFASEQRGRYPVESYMVNILKDKNVWPNGPEPKTCP